MHFNIAIFFRNSSRLTFWGFIGYTIFVALFTWIFVARRKNKEAKQIRTSHMAQVNFNLNAISLAIGTNWILILEYSNR